MADLSVTITVERVNPIETVYGAARGVITGALIVAGMMAATPVHVAASGTVELIDNGPRIHIVDSVTAQLTSDIQVQIGESLKVADTVLGPTLNPEQAGPTEASTAHWDDGGFVTLIGLGNPIRITDTVIAVMTDGGLSTALSESLKVADTVTPAVQISAVLSESLKVVDSVQCGLTPLLVTITAEQLSVADSGFVELSVEAEIFKLADTAAGTLNPEQANPSEALKVQDAVTAALVVGGDLSTTVSPESLKVVDSCSRTLDPLQTSVAEALKVVDSHSETLNPLQASPSESVRIADTPSGTLNPLQASPSEAVKVADQASAGTNRMDVSASEAVHVVDQVLAAIFEFTADVPADWACLVPLDEWTCVVPVDDWTVSV